MPLTEADQIAAAAQAKLAVQRARQTGFNAGRGILADNGIHDSSIESLVADKTARMTAEQIDSFIAGLQAAAASRQNRVILDFPK